MCAALVPAGTLTLVGPALTSGISGWPDSGLSITALQSVTLESFIFENQGSADTIRLYNASESVLHTYSSPAADATHLATVQLGAYGRADLLPHF